MKLNHRIILNENHHSAKNKPGLFLDRDGVIIEDMHYINDPSLVKLIPGVKQWIRNAYLAGWTIVIITNQSGISRGNFGRTEYEKVTHQLLSLLGNPYPIHAIYANGLGPEIKTNSWRKPNPNMLLEASKDLDLDLKKSLLVGDRISDLIAGARAGLKEVFHVSSGHGLNERKQLQKRISNSGFLKGEENEPKIKLHNTITEIEINSLKVENKIQRLNQ